MIEGSGAKSGSGSIPLTSGYGIQIRESQKHVDPVDPDPKHWMTVGSKITVS
jgi:hypothetical protein